MEKAKKDKHVEIEFLSQTFQESLHTRMRQNQTCRDFAELFTDGTGNNRFAKQFLKANPDKSNNTYLSLLEETNIAGKKLLLLLFF